jgi:hypothetical protein
VTLTTALIVSNSIDLMELITRAVAVIAGPIGAVTVACPEGISPSFYESKLSD